MLKELVNADAILTCDMLLTELNKNFNKSDGNPYDVASSLEDVLAAVVLAATMNILDDPLESNGIIDITGPSVEIINLIYTVYGQRGEYNPAQEELYKNAVLQIALLKIELLAKLITELRDNFKQ